MAAKKKGLLIAVSGLSGSGKSTLSRRLTKDFNNAVRVSTDEVRKDLAGVPHAQKLDEKFYKSTFSAKTVKEFNRRVTEGLKDNGTVIAEGFFVNEKSRARMKDFAAAANADFAGLWLDAPASVLKARAEARKGTGDVSDADAKTVAMQLRFRRGAIDWDRLDATQPPEQVHRQALKALGKRAPR